ncbi:MAG: type II toxin-antitoxin system HicA family toxin [Actinobacteria bacterium]|nr:type II toxin-antitoxin system HicA family toxin [Actinomycetota bacterium]
MPRKVGEIIKLLEADGWMLERTRGSHRVYVHRDKSGIVVVPGKLGKDWPIGTERSILKQAGLLR